MNPDVFKQRLRSGELVSLVNADYACPALVEFVGGLGVDAVMIDCEQGNPSFQDVEDLSRAARGAGMAAIVRVPSPEPWTLERYLLRGVDGLVVPRLDTADQVAKVVEDVRYVLQTNFARKSLIIQVESASALAQLDDFLAIPEVDCFFIGAVDLSKSLGFGGSYQHPDMLAVLDDTVARIRAQGRSVGGLVKEADVAAWRAKGVNMLYSHINDYLMVGVKQWNVLAGMTRAERANSSAG
jgi:4-hydroxy-2-oxoheptanedioate aldolase